MNLGRDEAEALIMRARVKAGWISEADLATPATAEEPAAEAAEPAQP
jgi:N utilization substance protein A